VVPLVLGEGGTGGRRRGREVEVEEEVVGEEEEEEEGKGEGEPRMCLISPRRRACSYLGGREEGREGGKEKEGGGVSSYVMKRGKERKALGRPSFPPALPPSLPSYLPFSRLHVLVLGLLVRCHVRKKPGY